jgi:hypothetical protein
MAAPFTRGTCSPARHCTRSRCLGSGSARGKGCLDIGLLVVGSDAASSCWAFAIVGLVLQVCVRRVLDYLSRVERCCLVPVVLTWFMETKRAVSSVRRCGGLECANPALGVPSPASPVSGLSSPLLCTAKQIDVNGHCCPVIWSIAPAMPSPPASACCQGLPAPKSSGRPAPLGCRCLPAPG